jgi:MOSC domain-containing protein YiiM
MSTVVHIFVASKRGAPMSAAQSVEALTDGGLTGDRYSEAKNRRSLDYQVTFIELENIQAFTQATGLPLTPDMPRRNIITRGIRLNGLCGKRFKVGRARFEGLELCEPCSLFARRTHREVLAFFVGKGGLRARIVSGGEICVGDAIEEDA